MRQAVFLTSPEVWKFGHGPNHPLKPQRLQRTVELLQQYRAFKPSNVQVVAPRQATDAELALFHTPEYIQVVKVLSSGGSIPDMSRYGFRSGDNPIFAGMRESEVVKVGSTLQGAEMLVRSECDVAFSYSGGLHHGSPARASGFCVFNDAAVAIHWLLQQNLRVASVST